VKKRLICEKKGEKINEGGSIIAGGSGGCYHEHVVVGAKTGECKHNQIYIKHRSTDECELVCNRSEFLKVFRAGGCPFGRGLKLATKISLSGMGRGRKSRLKVSPELRGRGARHHMS
jgi:hypothetical protein